MNDNTMDVIYVALLLILPVSALVARRLPLAETLKMALAWVAIFGLLFALVSLWQEATGAGSMLGAMFR